MLLFWIVYGAWMVFIWVGILFLGLILSSSLLSEITQGDYNLSSKIDKFKSLLFYNDLVGAGAIVGFGVQCVHIFALTANSVHGAGNKVSYHNIAVRVAEWTSTTLQTPLLITLVIVGIVFLLKKAYPLFKKIKTLTDNLK